MTLLLTPYLAGMVGSELLEFEMEDVLEMFS
jgi:hypothetical protein